MFNKIMVPLDGSVVAERALFLAERVAPLLGVELTLIHILDPSESTKAHMHESYLKGVVENSQRRIGEQSKTQGFNAVRVSPVFITGNPVDELVNFANKNEKSLMVMSTRNASGIRRWALGSVSEKVYRQTGCPCILVGVKEGENNIPPGPMKGKILVPVGRTMKDEDILPFVEELAKKLSSEIILLRIVPPILAIEEEEYEKAAYEFTREAFVERLEQTRKEEAREQISKLSRNIKARGIVATEAVEAGSTEEGVFSYAERIKPDLIALPAEGQSAQGHWVLGKMAKKLLREGNSPVLIVKPSSS